MPSWTKEQLEAINEEGKNIIVSAGAGSGKTAVLSERVIRKLEKTDINKLLILTFTKEAANEMKERIRKKIKKNPNLKKQLDIIDSAYITTFDSYSLSLVKKYYYLLNISPNISIIDASIINIKKEENDKKLESLRREHERAIEDFNQKKSTDAGQEKALRDAYETQEKKYAAVIGEYDIDMQNNKKDMEEKNKEKEQLTAILENKKDELDTLENKYQVLKENFLLTQQKCKDVDYMNKVKERSVEWIQAQFRGYWTRKTMKKKFKFLSALTVNKKPKEEDAGKGKGKKGKK